MQKHICYKSGINSFNFSCTGSHKRLRIRFVLCLKMKFFDILRSTRRKFLKNISIHCTKCNEINIRHLDIQKHVSYEKLFKYYAFFEYSFTQKSSNALQPMGGKF